MLPVHKAVFFITLVSVLHFGEKLILLVTFLKVRIMWNVRPLPKYMIIANLKINCRVFPADTWCHLSGCGAERGHSEVPPFPGSLWLLLFSGAAQLCFMPLSTDNNTFWNGKCSNWTQRRHLPDSEPRWETKLHLAEGRRKSNSVSVSGEAESSSEFQSYTNTLGIQHKGRESAGPRGQNAGAPIMADGFPHHLT